MPKSEIAQLSEKELKYELFRALRRHEGEHAIAILEDPRTDSNWQHAYKGRSVLMQAYFENEAKVFLYLLKRPEVDATILDDDGHSIYFWMRYMSDDAKIDYQSELIRSKGPGPVVERKTHFIDSFNYDTKFYEQERYALYLNRKYRLLDNFRGMKKGQMVTFIGIHGEPGERSWDDYHDFEHENGKITSIPYWKMPDDLRESKRIFEDVFDDVLGIPEEVHPIIHGLKDRSQKVRVSAANKINKTVAGFEYVMPILLESALRLTGTDNAFIEALKRLGKPGMDWLEGEVASIIAADINLRQYKRILSKLGSSKLLKKYYVDLNDSNPYTVRFAITQLQKLQDGNAITFLKKLVGHENYNVRSNAKKTIDYLEGLKK